MSLRVDLDKVYPFDPVALAILVERCHRHLFRAFDDDPVRQVVRMHGDVRHRRVARQRDFDFPLGLSKCKALAPDRGVTGKTMAEPSMMLGHRLEAPDFGVRKGSDEGRNRLTDICSNVENRLDRNIWQPAAYVTQNIGPARAAKRVINAPRLKGIF